MKFNDAIKILLNEDIDHLEEMARLPDHLRLPGVVNPNFDKEEAKRAIQSFFKEKPLGLFAKINNNIKDLEPSSIILPAIDELIEEYSIDDDDSLKEAMFNFHGHNSNVTQNKLAQKIWKKIADELGVDIAKTKIKQTLLQLKAFMKNNGPLFVSTDQQAMKQTSRPAAAKNYKIIKDFNDAEVQEQLTNQFDRHVARSARFLNQGEVLPVSEIKSFFDTFQYNAGDIIKFLIDIGAIEPSDEIKSDETESDDEETSSADKEVKDLDPDFFVKGDNDVSNYVDTSDIRGDTDFMSSNY